MSKGVPGGPSGPSREGPGVGHKIVSDTKQMTNKREKKTASKSLLLRLEVNWRILTNLMMMGWKLSSVALNQWLGNWWLFILILYSHTLFYLIYIYSFIELEFFHVDWNKITASSLMSAYRSLEHFLNYRTIFQVKRLQFWRGWGWAKKTSTSSCGTDVSLDLWYWCLLQACELSHLCLYVYVYIVLN